MKAFIAYRHTGEKTEYLEELLTSTRDALTKAGVDSYCTFFDESKFQDKSLGARQIMEHAFSIIDHSDMLFVILTSENRSEGVLIEAGYCIAKNIPVVVAVQSGVKHTYLPEMASKTFRWTDREDLQHQIETTDYSSLKTIPIAGSTIRTMHTQKY